ncbi:hypothetical protein OC861_002213 [Tilletia horrida]|nr:hypothetical protein OC845_002047 [Tilletia horrida]KAK0568194.1 hypothetical protein OC861_002213 [Tilletia horrida]
MVSTNQRNDGGDGSSSGTGAGGASSSTSRASRHPGITSQHRSKSGTTLSRASRSGSRTSLASHGRNNSSHRLSALNTAAVAAGLTMTRTNSTGAGGNAGGVPKSNSSTGTQHDSGPSGSHSSAAVQNRQAASGSNAPVRRSSASSSASASAARPSMSNIAAPGPSAPRRGIPPAKKPVKFTMGADEEDEETESDEWSEDEQPARKQTQNTGRTQAAGDNAPQIPRSPKDMLGTDTQLGRMEEDHEKGDEKHHRQEDEEVADHDDEEDDDDAWSSDEPTEEEMAREAQRKAAEERTKKFKEEERRQRELFQKVEVPLRSASVADMTALGRNGARGYDNGHYQPGAMGPPLAPPTRSLLSTLFNSEQENQIRAYRLSRMMGSQAEADQVRKAQIAAHASQPHLPQHAHEQAQARALAQRQVHGQPPGRNQAAPQSSQAQQRPSRPLQQVADQDRPRRSSSIVSNSSTDLNMLRPSKSAVALPLLSKLELKSRTSQAGPNAPSGSYLRRTPSDAGSGSVGSASRSVGEKAADPILRLEPVLKDEQISSSLSNRSLREQRNGHASGQNAPSDGNATSALNSAVGRSKSVERHHVAAPMQAPSVAAHRHSSTALNQLDNGMYGHGGEEGYDLIIPPGAIAQTPRTTRRNMLRDELSESVRANLLWERQSRTRRMGSSSGLASGFAAAQANQAKAPAPAPGSSGGSGSGSGDNSGSGGRQGPLTSTRGPPPPPQRSGGSTGGRPGQKNTVLSGDRLRPLTSSNSSHTSPTPYDQQHHQQHQHHPNQSRQRQHEQHQQHQHHHQQQQHQNPQQYQQHSHPRRPGLGPNAYTQRTASDNGPESGASSSDEDMYSDSARRRHTYDYNNSFHHKGW